MTGTKKSGDSGHNSELKKETREHTLVLFCFLVYNILEGDNMESLILVRLDSKYCDYLRQFDKKVPYNYDKKELRPFIGVLFEVHNCKYFAPLSSPKPKHKTMKTTLDFWKIANGNLGAINFNNMLPVMDKNIIKLDLDKECLTKTEEKYTKMLKEQIFWLNRNDDKLYGRSKKLYDKYINGTLNESIAKRCCDFKLLEEKCIEYNKNS